ncbi:TIGR02680 family protein [Catellatospora sp. NPDC049111]|uniref:TIGR02680 family protein n=1 Tax=Catellatospora sp. NPDC049111 TaxID=3155271 RepID=UPI0033FBD75B
MRFVPTRAGIINLWDYRDEEFIFVDGWLVLRGPNGSGKTKALEVLFPFLLDGRIEPRRLNPFAGEDRTMKSNVLYRGQEQSHAYVWMEFGRPETGEHVTIGIGLRAHRHVDKVTRHHFVTNGRVGVDFSLIDPGDRPLNRRDLTAALGAESVYDTAEEYRHAVDARLFGLGAARYEQLLDLVLTLRKPQLAKDLNPVELSRTLQRGLRPLDDGLIIEAAGSFDDMEAVARTLEGLVAADRATASFLSVYSTYLRTHARAAADGLTARRSAVDQAADALAAAHAEKETAEAAHQAAEHAVDTAEGEPGRLRAHLERLKSSTAYQSHEQLADLRRHAADLARIAAQSATAAAREESAARNRLLELEVAQRQSADAASQVTRLLRTVADEAEQSGVAWTAADSEPEGFGTRAAGRITARRDDIRVLRAGAAAVAQTERDHAKSADAAAKAATDVDTAEADEQAAETAVTETRGRVAAAIATWASQHAQTLAEVDADQSLSALTAAVEHLGEAGQPTLRELFTDLTMSGLTAIRQEIAALDARHETLRGRQADLTAERDRITAEHDDAPPAWPTRTADRTGRPGAPLWRLVRFTDRLAVAEAASVEAALEASGILDAWIHPDAALTSAALSTPDSDGYLLALPVGLRPAGRTLDDLLVAEEQEFVPAQVVEAVLASIAVTDSITGPAGRVSVSTSGKFAQGIVLGRAAKAVPEYIGATARAARRAARIAECDRLIAQLSAETDDVDQARVRLGRTVDAVQAAGRELPSPEPVHTALRQLDLAANTLKLRRESWLRAAAALDQAIAERAEAGKALRRAAAERHLPADRVDAVADAVRRFESAAEQVPPARAAAARATVAVAQAQERHTEAADRCESARADAHEAAMRSAEKTEELQTLTAAVDDADVRRVLTEVADTEQRVTEAEAKLTAVREDLRQADRAQAAAAVRVDAAVHELQQARTEALREAARLRPFAHADLLGILRCPADLRWPAQRIDDPAAPLPSEITALHEAILAATRELNPTENSLKQSATRLNGALTDLQTQLPAAGLDHRPEWATDDGVVVVRVADEQGLSPVAHFAERIARERYDQEQLLSDAERRILEDALLTQLARQIHQRTVESRDLVKSMDAQMRARRMSSGLTVGVGWQLSDDLDADQREACTLLERDPARLNATQLATLRRHFATRIKSARAMSPDLPYRDLLAQVLDYRQWRTFKFTLHRPGGVVENLTKARHSQLSGGEQSVSLHLPLFAAANALFASALPSAPRMLGLDEAFAGVDDNGRRELMALAAEFDLDLFMTGYDLWATHSQVRGAAHYDLSHSAGESTVATVLLVWNGTHIEADFDGTLARAFGSPETRRVPQPSTPVDALTPEP